jgi:hypothetical protein
MCEEDPLPPIVHTFMFAIPNMILVNQNNEQLDDAKERSEVFADNLILFELVTMRCNP